MLVEHGLMIQTELLVFELFTVAIVDLDFSFIFQCTPLVCSACIPVPAV